MIQNTLTLPLKKKWFEMIKSGCKPEEYRDFNYYWAKRLTHNDLSPTKHINGIPVGPFKHFNLVVFTSGYPSKSEKERIITFHSPTIHIGTGKPEWGAEPGKTYFVIRWESIRNENY